MSRLNAEPDAQRRPQPHDRARPQPDGARSFPSDAAEPEEELIMHLERDQLAAETLRPLPRAHLARRAVLALWVLRVFVVLLSAMVIYTFIARLS
jgi:hypothetical protein